MGEQQSPGREANDAEPLGKRSGLVSDKDAEKSGRESQRRAGPDGPDAKAIGDTFKQKPRG